MRVGCGLLLDDGVCGVRRSHGAFYLPHFLVLLDLSRFFVYTPSCTLEKLANDTSVGGMVGVRFARGIYFLGSDSILDRGI
jgi:hypothetical protein